MSDVYYNFNATGSLAGMAPPAAAGGGFGPATLPAGLVGQGMYIITNTNTNNRYIGISTNLANRFNTRMATITECGFAAATMGTIFTWWGQAATRNTGAGAVVPLLGYLGPLNVMIDGAQVNLERLLIRYVINLLGGGGTVSNNIYAGAPYVNPTPNAVTVHFHSAANAHFAAHNHNVVWPVGGAW